MRAFTREPVSDGDLRDILEAATRAPSGGNRQAWRFVVVRNRDIITRAAHAVSAGIERLGETHPGLDDGPLEALKKRHRRFSLFFAEAPVVIFAFCDPSSSVTAAMLESEGLSRAEAERESGHVEVQSVAAAVENLLLAAHSLGYGACWMNPPHFARRDLSGLLGVGEPYRLTAIVPLGRPSEPARPGERRPLGEVTRFLD